jgi:uncharacterized protein YjbI with pentapeptide repeats
VCSSFQDSNYSSAKKLEVLSCTSFSLDDSSPLKQNDVRLSPVALISKIKSTESERTSISHANFTWAVLQDVLLSETFLAGSDLRGARFLGSYLESVPFDGADLKGAMFWRTRLFDTTFQNADLSGSLWRGSIGVDMDVTGATVGGVSIVGSRLVATTVARTTAKAGGEDILESILEVDDDSRYRARWRGVVGPALLKGANPFPSKETGEESICEIGIMGTADNCVTEEDARQRRARRFVEIACGDSTNVPVRWWSAPSVMTERQRSEYLKKSIDVLLRRDEISLDKEVEDASGEAKNVVPSPAWVRELAGRILDKGCEKPKDALSKEDQAALEEQIGPAK